MVTRHVFLRSAIWASINQYISWVIGLAGTIVVARLITPDEFGLFSLMLSWVEVAFILSSWGFQSALMVFPSEQSEHRDTLFSLHMCGIAASVVVGILICLSFFVREQTSEASVMSVLILIAVLQSFSYFYSAFLEKKFEFRQLATFNTASLILTTVSCVAFAYYGWGVWSLVLSTLIGQVALLIMLVAKNFFIPAFTFNSDYIRQMMRFSGSNFLMRVLEICMLRLDRLLIGSYLSHKDLGFYARAVSTAEIPQKFTVAIVNTVSLPTYASLRNDRQTLARAFYLLNTVIFRFIVIVTVPVVALSGPMFRLLYGEQWLPSASLFVLLSGLMLFNPLYANLKQMLLGIGRPDLILRVGLARLAYYFPLLLTAIHFDSVSMIAALASADTVIAYALIVWFAQKEKLALDHGEIWMVPLGVAAFVLGSFAWFKNAGWIPSFYSPLPLGVAFVTLMVVTVALMILIERKRWIEIVKEIMKARKPQ